MITFFIYKRFLSNLLEPIDYDRGAIWFSDKNISNRFVRLFSIMLFIFETVIYVCFFIEAISMIFFSK